MNQSKEILRYFADFIEVETGIVYAEHNYYQLESRLETICKFLNVADVEALYSNSLGGISGNFRELLLDLATNNETSFFRDSEIFTGIESILLPLRIDGLEDDKPELKIWSAASSTGQEALSIAIMIAEFNRREKRNFRFSIAATDISSRVIKKAKLARYSQLEVQRGLPTPLLLTYFTKDEENCWTAKKFITENIRYEVCNLKEFVSPAKKFDLIFCRNMLIYQSVESKIDILKRLTASLSDGGYLILGAGESLLGLSTDYEQVLCANAVFYRKKHLLKKLADEID